MSRLLHKTLIGGQNAYIIVPQRLPADVPAPVIIYCHGAGDDATTAFNGNTHSDIYDALAAEGIIVAAITSGGIGNDANLAGVRSLYDYIAANWTVSKVAFMAQSMGGVVSQLALTGLGGVYPNLKGFLGIYPVSSLATFYTNPTYTPVINAAYNISGGGSYAAQTAGRDPALIPAASYPNIRYRYYGSAADGTVPLASHAAVMGTKLTMTATKESTVVTTVGVHGDSSNFRAADVVAFFKRCFAD